MSNAALKLKNLIAQDTFSTGELFPVSFVVLLAEMCELVSENYNNIQTLTEKAANSATKAELGESMNYIKSIKTEMTESFNQYKGKITNDMDSYRTFQATRMADFDNKFKELNQTVETAVNTNLEPVKQILSQNELATNQLKSQLSTLTNSSKNTTDLLNSLRAAIPPNPESRLTHFSKRIDIIENSQRNAIKELKEKNEKLKLELAELHRDDQEIKVELHNTILEIEAKAKALPSTYKNEDDQPKIVNGEVDISPLIRGIFRDSRRLDGFNEMIAMTRMETEDIVNSMIDLQEKMQQFNHITHDLALDDGRNKAFCIERIRFLQASIVNLEKQIGDIWTLILQISENNNHITSNISNTFEQIQSILITISNRPLPLLNNLSDVMLECRTLHESIFEKRTQFEGEREKFHKLPTDNEPHKRIPEILVSKLQRRVKPVQDTVTLPYDDIRTKDRAVGQTVGDALTQRSLEELRVKMNELLAENEEISQQFEYHRKATQEMLEIKVDAPTVERMIHKIHTMVGYLTKRVEIVEETEKSIIEAARNKRPIKDPNGPTMKTSKKGNDKKGNDKKGTFTVPGDVPPLKLGNAGRPLSNFISDVQSKRVEKTPLKYHERPKTAQKLVSDLITMPPLQVK
ncbi:hypothetical protein TRFO_01054 [Tritrichomonas foetus]|uniref:Uncharacterized protein n=1 Tax=Tritrichomonas foetus TaxID=1144522 RepID=A0A1J4KP09_9EUKA|nr:hypothetical protein TRFO_01054 [Tritrichomonas foetus]|eukprot:OHT11157.1 hypothetical protein TRFO_01054 [Tritrichomonas foetus]